VKFVGLVDESLKVGELERELLVTYDPAAIKEIVPKLASKVGNNQAVYLTDKVRTSCVFLLISVLIWIKEVLFDVVYFPFQASDM